MKQDYGKLKIAMRYYLIGKNYNVALKAMEFGLKYHVNFRKDGVTPEFQHQISQASFARTLSNIIYPEELLATIFLHDVVEDYDIKIDKIYEEFDSRIGDAVQLMTNKYGNGHAKDKAFYYSAMIDNPIASIAKGCDRLHNLSSCNGVFSKEKIKLYVEETNEYIAPMLKAASRIHTKQENAYMNIRSVLQIQSEMLISIANSE